MTIDPILQPCPACQHPLAPGDTTCSTCGHVLAEAADTAEVSTVPPAAAESAPASAAEALPPAIDDTATHLVEQPASQPAASDTSPALGARFISRPRNRIVRLVLIGAAILLILGAVGTSILALTRPQPLITVTSDYHFGSVPAGAAGTTLHITGKQFSGYASIIFLLDGRPAPGSSVIPSDENGAFEADLPITAKWTVGAHQLTARDASGNTTHASSKVMIVQPGQATTPGPNGAPADDTARFTLYLSLLLQDAAGLPTSDGVSDILTVQGRPDPAGGAVCDLRTDDGKPRTADYSLTISVTLPDGTTRLFVVHSSYSLATKTTAYTCSGVYQGGQISYTQTNTVDQEVYGNGVTCNLTAPYINFQIQGVVTSATTARGTFSFPASELKCSDGNTEKTPASAGIWTAILLPA